MFKSYDLLKSKSAAKIAIIKRALTLGEEDKFTAVDFYLSKVIPEEEAKVISFDFLQRNPQSFDQLLETLFFLKQMSKKECYELFEEFFQANKKDFSSWVFERLTKPDAVISPEGLTACELCVKEIAFNSNLKKHYIK